MRAFAPSLVTPTSNLHPTSGLCSDLYPVISVTVCSSRLIPVLVEMENSAALESASALTVPAAQRAIGIPEILHAIQAECSTATQEKSMWVSRYWRSIAQVYFWREVRDVRKFFNMLSRLDHTKQVRVSLLTSCVLSQSSYRVSYMSRMPKNAESLRPLRRT